MCNPEQLGSGRFRLGGVALLHGQTSPIATDRPAITNSSLYYVFDLMVLLRESGEGLGGWDRRGSLVFKTCDEPQRFRPK